MAVALLILSAVSIGVTVIRIIQLRRKPKEEETIDPRTGNPYSIGPKPLTEKEFEEFQSGLRRRSVVTKLSDFFSRRKN
jgi:hypothetical protein